MLPMKRYIQIEAGPPHELFTLFDAYLKYNKPEKLQGML